MKNVWNKIQKANEILHKYNLDFQLADFRGVKDTMLQPSLSLYNRKNLSSLTKQFSISLHIENDKVKFFLREIFLQSYDSVSYQEKLKIFTQTIQDIETLNALEIPTNITNTQMQAFYN